MSSRSLLPTAPAGRLAVRVVALCWLAVLVDGLDLFVYGAVLPGLLADDTFGLDAATAGDIGSLTTFGMLLGALSSGLLSDRIGRRPIILVGVALFSVASAGCALAPDATAFGAARFAAGLGLGGLLPTAISMVMEFAPQSHRNIAVTVLMTAHQAGGALAGSLARGIVEALGWRSVFWLGALPLVLVLPLLAALLPESITFQLARGRRDRADRAAARYGVDLADFTPAAVPDERTGLRGLFAPGLRRTTLLFWTGSFAGLLLVYGVSTWLPTMMRGAGYDLGSAVGFLVVINLGGIVGMLVAGRLADRFGARAVAVLWFALTAVAVGLLAVRMPLPLTYTVVFVAGAWLFSAQTLVYAAVGATYPARNRATAVGWVAGVGRLGAVAGPWVGGQLVAADASRWGFVVFAVAGVVGAVMVGLARPGRPARPVDPAEGSVSVPVH
ncbi:MFS transporter [Kineococcus glutinatus]|uniref:Aromatic acid/H+ symport family MFS transporter n=1 Tax=Kineococcus glutinatus TaxID=1070872 RepID=A0ABP9H3N8_9ACTN